MFTRIRSYLTHYRVERRATILVFLICAVVLIITAVLTTLYEPDAEPLAEQYFENAGQSRGASAFSGSSHASEPNNALSSLDSLKSPVEALFDFDPNTLSDSGYLALGFTEREISTLRKYLASGAAFRQKSDFARLYFIDEERFEALQAHILLPDIAAPRQSRRKVPEQKRVQEKVQWSDTARYESYKYDPVVADLNTSDTTELKKVPGLGSFYARKIVERREALGGFHSLSQLLELWKMSPERIDQFAHRVSIDSTRIELLPINHLGAQELSAHPYLSFALANRIVNHRESRGRLKSIDELVEAGLLDAELKLKLAPYLSFE